MENEPLVPGSGRRMASRSSAATVERRKKPFRRAHSQRSRPGASSKRISDGTEYMDIELQAIYAAEVENGLGVYNRGYSVNEDDDERGPIDISEFIDDVSGLRDDQGFQTQIARKMRVYLIGKQEAEIEVLLDRLVEAQGGLDKALLSVVSTVYTEIKVETFVRILLFRGANPTSTDDQKQTPLHYAVRRGLIGVCTRLLEYDAHPLAKDQDSASPFKIALTKKSDEIAASLLQYIPAATVRQIYASTETQTAEFSFHHLIHTGMQKTALGVLDCMLELCSRCTENYRVYYQVLEGDEKGRGPDHPDFNRSSKSALQLIAQFGNNEIGYHNVVRLLVRRKWRKFAKWRFQFNAIVFLISLFALTYTAVVSTMTNDPTVYDTPLQISRAAFEAIGFCQVAYSLLLELVQMCRHRIEYFKDRFNWHDLISIGLLLSVIPLRYTPYKYAQWPVFSAGYLAWTFRIFKYAPVFRQTGAYAQTLWRVFAQDFPQFTILFAVILLAFSGSFLLALRGEDMLGKHEETRNFWHILFTGVRTLVEGEPIVTYTGAQTQYGAMGSVLMVLFLITCSIILLNILIAQLSDTYQTVQNDALRSLELNRAWIVARVEINSVCTGKGYRTRYYKDIEEIPNLQRALDWDKEPVTPYSKVIDQMAAQMTIQEQNMVTIKNRMARQEKLLVKIQ
ncbi:uncharacterized protein LOC141903117 [Tubulanus polymorphus]|uniref:uncharacterized protein LOC141903117 n=1 Tax=Tubulanus polymorphus TaxID=672921 RepID=UPI003DA36626